MKGETFKTKATELVNAHHHLKPGQGTHMSKALNKIMQAAGEDDISEKIVKMHSGLPEGGTMLRQLLQLVRDGDHPFIKNAYLIGPKK